MSLKMAALNRTKAGTFVGRKGIPADVRPEYERLFGQRREAWFSAPPGTSLIEAKARFGEWLSEVEARIKAIRTRHRGEAQSLTPKQARALVGEWYRWFLSPHEDNPGDPDRWDRAFDNLIGEIEESWGPEWEAARHDLIRVLENEAVRMAIRPYVADNARTAQFLASRGLVLNPETQSDFLDQLVITYANALLLLKRRAEGDYSPDTDARQFPKFAEKGRRPVELFEQWVREAQPAASTVRRWRTVFETMQAHFARKEITEDGAREWMRSLITADRVAATVSAIWLGSAKTVYAWAKEQKLISTNPFAGVTVTVPRKIRHRTTKAFTADEARTILSAASKVAIKNSYNAAQRWVPWLCAYSGARAGEITQLRGVDIEKRGEIWVMRLTPEAGTIKTRAAREVPLHEHIIAQGFLDYIKQRGKGPLFYNLDKSEAQDNPLKPKQSRPFKTRQRIAVWVRSLGVNDPELQPNHAWRHTFKQIAERAGISERVSDAITGHAPATVGRAYGAPTVEDMSRELGKFPRYPA